MANDPLKDTSLEDAQKEIHRRLLREEKLKRIEQEEMRRLSGMGWKPPIERTAAHRGPSVHDAADAIEVTEQKRRAFAQEAQRRAEARQSDPIGTRDEFEVRRRAEDRKALAQYPDQVQAALEQVEKNARGGGAINAADMLRRYLEMTGGTVHFLPKELRRYDIIRDAEKRVQEHFSDWMTKPKSWIEVTESDGGIIGHRGVQSDFERLAPELVAMKDGDTLQRKTYWDARFQYPSDYEEGLKWYAPSGSTNVSSIDLQGFAGRAKLRGDGDFTFKRRGSEIDFRGIVQQNFNEPYDFETGTEFPTLNPWDPFERISGEDVRQLALHGRAKEFRMQSQWPRQVEGTLRIKPNGRIEFAGDPRWRDIDPYELQPWP